MLFIKLVLLNLFTIGWAHGQVLFIDLNQGKSEIEAAKRVAKAKGKKLIVYPSADEEFDLTQLKTIISENSFASLCVSGHNGGLYYSGTNGDLGLKDLFEVLSKSPSQQSIEGVYLLGCNGANKSKIALWKEALPNLKFLAGYDGTAPLSHNLEGIRYFEDALSKQAQITAASNAQVLKNLMTTLKSVNSFETSVYATCEPIDKEFLFLPKRSGSERFGEMSTEECISKKQTFKNDYLQTIKKYWSGELEPTKQNPNQGFLKDAYVFMRQNAHCFDDSDIVGFDADQLLFLRFNREFNQNYFEYYKDLLTQYVDELEAFTSDPEAFIKDVKEKEKIALEQLEDLKAHPQKYAPVIEREKTKLHQQMNAILKVNPTFARCLTTPSPECDRFEGLYNQYYPLEERLKAIDSHREHVDQMIKRLKAHAAERSMPDNNKESTKRLVQLIRKGLNTPVELTRKEIMEMAHLRMAHPIYSEVVGVSSRVFFQNIEEMSGYVFPFSWHERIKGRPIDPPLSPSDVATPYFSRSLPKEYGAIARVLDDNL